MAKQTEPDMDTDTDMDTPDSLPPPYDEVLVATPEPTGYTQAGSSAWPHAPLQQETRSQQDTSLNQPLQEDTRPSQTLSPFLSSDPSALCSLIEHEARVPLRVVLNVRGTHTERHRDRDGKETHSTSVVDFDFKIDLSGYVVGEGDRWYELRVARDGDGVKMYRGGRCRSRRWKGYKRAPDVEDGGEAEREGLVDGQGPGLLGWCERFCGDTSPVKRFAFSRYIGGFDASVVESTLTSALRAINYKGNISVSVSCPNRSFAVYSPHLVNRLRDNSFVYYACVILQLWVITWPVIWALERRYEVVCPVWSFYRQVGSRREYARGRSEEEIADHLVPVVTQAACERRAGARFLTDQDFRILRRHGQDSGERVVVASWERVSGWGRDE